MHELGIMTSVMESVTQVAQENNASKLISITLKIGEMTEVIEDSMHFAFEVIKETDEFAHDAELIVHMVQPRSVCMECGNEFAHDRFHLLCPNCDSFATQLISGREMEIEAIEVDIPDDEDANINTGQPLQPASKVAPDDEEK